MHLTKNPENGIPYWFKLGSGQNQVTLKVGLNAVFELDAPKRSSFELLQAGENFRLTDRGAGKRAYSKDFPYDIGTNYPKDLITEILERELDVFTSMLYADKFSDTIEEIFKEVKNLSPEVKALNLDHQSRYFAQEWYWHEVNDWVGSLRGIIEL